MPTRRRPSSSSLINAAKSPKQEGGHRCFLGRRSMRTGRACLIVIGLIYMAGLVVGELIMGKVFTPP